jgi:hypothetical protein
MMPRVQRQAIGIEVEQCYRTAATRRLASG